ncbi:MAG: AAC(3) family N-acetyltransferase, partial [Clostridia bacterium]|nr:AAC(3) family N-acetyltransferase [Clostridia bacterium]
MNPITYALRRLGVREGGALVVHSSYKSLGPLAGDVQAVLEALRAAVGGDGVLLMPALSYRHVTAEHPLFDLRATPGNVGAIPEVFRRQPGVWRSLHPTHSVCAIGNGAEMITSDHGGDDTPVGPRSPLIANVERRGQ